AASSNCGGTWAQTSGRGSETWAAWISTRPRRAVGQRRTSIVLRPCTNSAAHGCFSDNAYVARAMVSTRPEVANDPSTGYGILGFFRNGRDNLSFPFFFLPLCCWFSLRFASRKPAHADPRGKSGRADPRLQARRAP